MTKPSFIIVADRGNLKAYEVSSTPVRGLMPRLVEAFEVAEAHGRYQDKFTDQAGAFPNNGSGGCANSIAERQTLDLESDSRVFRQLAHRIREVLERHHPPRWSFAASSEINHAILNGIPAEFIGRLDRNAKRDLVKINPADLLPYFDRA